eukprot:scaffold5178_cov364-Prasinococcus_capsulatus_cf.AAC.6
MWVALLLANAVASASSSASVSELRRGVVARLASPGSLAPFSAVGLSPPSSAVAVVLFPTAAVGSRLACSLRSLCLGVLGILLRVDTDGDLLPVARRTSTGARPRYLGRLARSKGPQSPQALRDRAARKGLLTPSKLSATVGTADLDHHARHAQGQGRCREATDTLTNVPMASPGPQQVGCLGPPHPREWAQ